MCPHVYVKMLGFFHQRVCSLGLFVGFTFNKSVKYVCDLLFRMRIGNQTSANKKKFHIYLISNRSWIKYQLMMGSYKKK